MFDQLSPSARALAIQRLTALWALNECGLGGVMHAVQSPFTGLLVGSIAMICIAFICAVATHKWQAVMTSLVIVLIIKALVSPHSTPTAYVAVIFQGVTGAIIYRYVPGLLFSSMLFVSLGLLESALQKLLTLTILYGNTLWNAIDSWGAWVLEKWEVILPLSSSRLIIYIYLGIHLLTGIFMGWFIYKTILATHKSWGDSKYQLVLRPEDKILFTVATNRKRKWKRYLLFIVLSVLIVITYTLQPQDSNVQKGLIALLRAVVILVAWFVFIAPLFLKLMKRFLAAKHQQLSAQVAHTMDIIPQLIWIVDRAWKETKERSFFARWKSFLIHSILYILQYKNTHDPDTHRPDTQSKNYNA